MVAFGYTILYVQDVERSITFYEEAFGFERKFITPGNEYGELNTGNTTLSFASVEQANTNLKNGFIEGSLHAKPFAMEIAFTTEDVDAIYNRAISCGAASEAAPALKQHGQTVAYVRDGDGFLIEICTPM